MIYLLTGNEQEAYYCAFLNGVRTEDWAYASQITDRSKGTLWYYGNYMSNPNYEEIVRRTALMKLKQVNKNQ